MSEALKITKQYFEASNRSDMNAIASLMTPATTYSSEKLGVLLGVDQIIEAQTSFHTAYECLRWDTDSMEEIHPGVVLIDFTLHAKRRGEDEQVSNGEEYVVVQAGKLVHVEVRGKRNKSSSRMR